MIRMIRNQSFWMGAMGCLFCFGFLQLVSNLPWAKAQALPAESGTKSLTASSGGVTYGGAGGAARLIPFQAYLTDGNGRPVEGQHGLTFRIYDDPTQGTPQWWETHGNVPVNRGMANVLLGSMTSFGSLTFDQARYVGVSVDGGVEMVPRQQIISAIHAVDANRLGGSPGGFWASSSEITPIGAIIPWLGDPVTLPSNWALCDGRTINDPASPLNGQMVPDMRGRLARGAAAGEALAQIGGQDSQGFSVPNHQHNYRLGIPDHVHDIASVVDHQHLTPILSDSNQTGPLWIRGGARFGVGGEANETAYQLHGLPLTSSNVAGTNAQWNKTSVNGGHTHSMNPKGGVSVVNDTDPAGTASGTISTIPSYVALHYIVRIK